MASSNTTWADISNDLAERAEKAGQCVVALHTHETHAASGVLWHPGVVVTANHATRPDELTVGFAAGESASARVKGRDPSTDLAIFTVEDHRGTTAARGDAAELRVGNVVMALARTRRGNLTASAGIISGLMDSWQTWQGGQIDRFIRPDLTLYRGYSGGPLINAKGEVVGINTSGMRRGTPITIPASTVTRVVKELLAKGHIPRPYLGVALQPAPLPENLIKSLNLAGRHGLLIVHLEENGPAARAGLMLGDILIEIAGKAVTPRTRIHGLLGNDVVGQPVRLGIIRSGESRQISVTLGDRFAQ